MWIRIREKGGIRLAIPVPAAILGSHLVSRIIAASIVDYQRKLACRSLPDTQTDKQVVTREDNMSVQIYSQAQICMILRKISKGLKQYRHLTLVEVETADGDYIKIEL